MQFRWLLVAAFAFLIGLGAGAVSLWRQSQQERIRPPVTPPAVSNAPELQFQGVLAAPNVISIPPPIQGVLEMVAVTVGTEVYEGMHLSYIRNTAIEMEAETIKEDMDRAQMNANNLESQLISERLEASRAQADLARAKAEFDAVEKEALFQQTLHRKGATPRLVYEKAWAEYEVEKKDYDSVAQLAKVAGDRVNRLTQELERARQTYRELRSVLDEVDAVMEAAQIVSPVNGLVTGMAARQGEEVSLTMESLFQIATDLSHMEAIVDPPPPELERILPGQFASIHLAERPQEVFQGIVREIREGRVYIEFRNPYPEIRPGLSAQVVISLFEQERHGNTSGTAGCHSRAGHVGAAGRADRPRREASIVYGEVPMEFLFNSLLDLITQTSTNLPPDVRAAMAEALKRETPGTQSHQSLRTG